MRTVNDVQADMLDPAVGSFVNECARDQGAPSLPQHLDQPPLLLDERVDLGRLVVGGAGDGMLLVERLEIRSYRMKVAHVEARVLTFPPQCPQCRGRD